MELQEKIELNKQLRSYKGDNSFVLSLQKQLKTSKYLDKVEVNGKMVKNGIVSSEDFKLDIADLPKGIYYLSVLGSSIQAVKLVKE
mgnify:CR=1 FL=1